MAEPLRAESVSFEYRVVWQREGRQRTTRIYQTEQAARRKIDGILALEEIKSDNSQWEDMPDLVAVPVLEVREVGEWTDHAEQPADAPTDDAREGVRLWAGPYDDRDGIF
jgi:hypothetical protein